MASRDIGGSIQAALRDLFAEKAEVEDAIHKLKSLLESMKDSVSTKVRGRPSSTGRKKATRKKVSKKTASKAALRNPKRRKKA